MKVRGPKSLMPRSLIGRTALILLVPIITVQLVVSYVFIQRLYSDVTEQMTRSVLPSVRLIADRIDAAPDRRAAEAAIADIAPRLEVDVAFDGGLPEQDARAFDDLSGRIVTTVLGEVDGVGPVDLATNDRRVTFALDTVHGPVRMEFSRSRASARNPHQLLVLMVFVSAIVTVVSFLFLKNQVRPIRRLANAAQAFGRGRVVPYRPSGATEVRQAGTAFLEMRDRIERHMEQRTLMLSGVSHDLRTPLTRMKLALSMMPEEEDTKSLERDVTEMQDMLDTFLGFARDEATETLEPVDPAALAHRVVEQAAAAGGDVTLGEATGEGMVDVRPIAMERALSNLVTNALRYGTKARVSVAVLDTAVRLTVEDNGPGIAPDRRDEAMRPFTRLDPSRNQDRGGSVGLGLAIVRDVARQHGGTLRLGESEDLGGLRADIVLAR